MRLMRLLSKALGYRFLPAEAVERLEEERRRLIADRDQKKRQIAKLKLKLTARAAETAAPAPGATDAPGDMASAHAREMLRKAFKLAFEHHLWRDLIAAPPS